MTTTPHSTHSRAVHLDALRGLAALVVVVTHFLAAFFPWAVFADSSRYGAQFTAHYAWEVLIHWPPLSILTAGHFAVCLFFVLSGFVLAWRTIGEPGQTLPLITAIIRRPFRLGGLPLFSLLIAAALWSAGLFLTEPVAALSGAGAWLDQFWAGDFDWRVFFKNLVTGRAGSEYNPPLWTIKIEVIGSFLVFFSLLVLNPLPRWARLALLGLMLVLMVGTYYDGFVIGMILADLFKFGRLNTWLQRVPVLPASALVLLAAAYPYYRAETALPDWLPSATSVSMVTATLLFLVVHGLPPWRQLLARPWLVRLGDLSYALYVLHFLVLGTVSAGLVLWLAPIMGYGWATGISFVVYMPLTFAAAAVATRWIDTPSIALGAWIGRQFEQRITAGWRAGLPK